MKSKESRVRLNNYHSEILKVCCEAKKPCAFEENFWERDIHFVVKNDGVYTYFNPCGSEGLFLLQSSQTNYFSVKIPENTSNKEI